MKRANKIFGIGMSKTGTTTLAECFRILNLGPHQSYDQRLKSAVVDHADVQSAVAAAEQFRTFEDAPWYLIFKELDAAYPSSKFILTMRASSEVHAISTWKHGVRSGSRKGLPTNEYMQAKMQEYENHSRLVLEHFRDRTDDLLIVCWESGSGWQELCQFLGVDKPKVPFPHKNSSSTGRNKLINLLGSRSLHRFRKIRYWLVTSFGFNLFRQLRDSVFGTRN